MPLPLPPPSLTAALERLAASRAAMPVRRTERLLLRPWQEADREPFAGMNADPEVGAWLAGPLDRDRSDRLLDRLRLDAARQGFGVFAVAERESRAFVGMVGLALPAFEAPFLPAVEVEWRLAPAMWGKGYATEAARDVLRWAFDTLRLPRVVSFTAATNTRSLAVMERLGLARAGAFDHPALPVDHPLRPHVLTALDAPWAVAADAEPEAPPEPAPAAADGPAPDAALPHVWIDGDGAPRVVKELVWRAVTRGAARATIVANRDLVVPRHRAIRAVRVTHGLDVADEWLVRHAPAGDLVVTADVPLAAELVARGVHVVSPRGEVFTPSNIGEKLSLRDFYTEARASGLIEGGGAGAFDERSKRAFANVLDRWIHTGRTGG